MAQRVPAKIRSMTKAILKTEGLWADHPKDRGGKTMRGVTLGSLIALGIKYDNDGDGDVDADDLKLLTEAQAIEIYENEYYFGRHVNRAPEHCQDALYDMVINAGGYGVMVMQKLINDLEGSQVLVADGVLGAQTATYAEKWDKVDADLFRDAYGEARLAYYFNLADGDPSQRVFFVAEPSRKMGTWPNRANKYMRRPARMKQKEFNSIKKGWGL